MRPRLARLARLPTAGSGIGLAIVSDVAARHRGTVALSDAPGGGTLVAVVPPLAR